MTGSRVCRLGYAATPADHPGRRAGDSRSAAKCASTASNCDPAQLQVLGVEREKLEAALRDFGANTSGGFSKCRAANT
jgi:hypothetical protein